MKDEDRKRLGEFSREIILFYSVLFFTCMIGIIELLPEFENIKGAFGLLSISAIYFGLLFGVVFGMRSAFRMYEDNVKLAGKFSFQFRVIEPFSKKGKNVRDFLTVAILVVFTLLYLVKTGVLH